MFTSTSFPPKVTKHPTYIPLGTIGGPGICTAVLPTTPHAFGDSAQAPGYLGFYLGLQHYPVTEDSVKTMGVVVVQILR